MRPVARVLVQTAFACLLQPLCLATADEKLEEPPIIMNVEPVIIEGEPIKDKMTPEEIRKKIQDALKEPDKQLLKEEWVSSDTMLVETRGAKYCVKFVPPHMRSSIDPVAGFAGICTGN